VLFTLLFTLAVASPIIAHPHVFIDNRMTIIFDKGIFQGISFQWTFDDMFSSMIFSDYNPKHAKQLNEAQIKAIKEGAFDNISTYHYFVAFWINKKPFTHFTIEQFSASVANGKSLVYSFFVPLQVPVQSAEQTVLVTIYDDSYYVAFDLLHTDEVTVQSGDDVSCALSIQKTQVKPQWPGQYMPDQLVIKFKEKS
jgi:ABC-type uncharacterized transport system substrate-binding protein